MAQQTQTIYAPYPCGAGSAGTLLSILWLADTTGHRRCTYRTAGSQTSGTDRRRVGALGPAGADYCASGVHRQPAHLACSGCDDPHAAQPESGVDRTGDRQHGGRVHRRTARGGRDDGHGCDISGQEEAHKSRGSCGRQFYWHLSWGWGNTWKKFHMPLSPAS